MHVFSQAPWLILASVTTLFWSSSLYAKEIGTFPSADGRFTVRLESLDPDVLTLGRTTTLAVHLAAKVDPAVPVEQAPLVGPPEPPLRVESLTFAATMPAHGHGMVLKPVISQVAPDVFHVEGVKLHMAGAWELRLDVQLDGEPEQFTVPISL